MKIFNKAIYIVAIVLSIFIGVLFAKAYPVQATQDVCFCHNVNNNPHTICTSNQGQINGHSGHVNNGTDTPGACQEVTPTVTLTPYEEEETCETCIDWDWQKTTCKFKIGQYCILWNYEQVCSEWENQCIEPTPTITPTPIEECNDCECKECEPEVIPSPTDTPKEDVEDGNFDDTRNNPIACVAKAPEKLPWDIKVIRNGSDATVKAFIPEGDKVNLYFKENSSPNWNHALGDIQVIDDGMRRVEVTIHDLVPSIGYTFGVQSVNSCTGGEIVGVVIDPPQPGVYLFSHWELLY